MNESHKLSKTFCILPWIHLHAWPDGRALLCCIADKGRVGDFSKNTYSEIINSEKLKQIRLDMLDGKKVSNCESCYETEGLTIKSLREISNKNYADIIPAQLENTLADGTLVEPKMYYMDYRFSNLCNLACRTCGGTLSSTIAAEKKEFTSGNHIIELRLKNVLNPKENVVSFSYARPNFLEVDVYPYLKDVRSIYFAGGEALMHDEHYRILKYIIDNDLSKQIQLTYSTNLTSLKYKGEDFIELWKNFDNINFLASIDGHEEKLEYIRKGTNNANVFSNLKKLLDFTESNPVKQFFVNICYTHSINNCYYTAEFFEYLDQENILDRLHEILWNNAFADRNRPYILPDFAKSELKEKRERDRSSPALQKAMARFPTLKHNYDVVDGWIDTKTDFSFDRFIDDVRNDNQYEKFKTSLPWLASVIERYKK